MYRNQVMSGVLSLRKMSISNHQWKSIFIYDGDFVAMDACEERSSGERLILRKALEGEQQRLHAPGVAIGILHQDGDRGRDGPAL